MMIKKNIICALVSAVLMVAVPVILKIVGASDFDAVMAWCMFLFFIVYPAAAVVIGILSGKDIRYCWFQPLLLAVLFTAGTWIAFDPGNPDFLIYSGIYLAIGYISAVITALAVKRKNRQ